MSWKEIDCVIPRFVAKRGIAAIANAAHTNTLRSAQGRESGRPGKGLTPCGAALNFIPFILLNRKSRFLNHSRNGRVDSAASASALSLALACCRRVKPQRPHRCKIIRAPPCTLRLIGSISPPQREARSPGFSSTCLLQRQEGQWLV